MTTNDHIFYSARKLAELFRTWIELFLHLNLDLIENAHNGSFDCIDQTNDQYFLSLLLAAPDKQQVNHIILKLFLAPSSLEPIPISVKKTSCAIFKRENNVTSHLSYKYNLGYSLSLNKSVTDLKICFIC